MEIAVSCGIGMLVATCLAGLLPTEGGRVPVTAGRSGAGGARGFAKAIGRLFVPRGTLPEGLAARALGELRFVELGGGFPLEDADDQELCGIAAGLCALGAVLLFALTGLPAALPIGGAVPLAVLVALASRRRKRQALELEEAMPEAFGALAISLGSGYSLSQAMRYVGSHAREPVRSEFMRVSFAIDCGTPAVEALDAMLDRLQAPGLDLVTLALKVSQRTGAPLKDLLAEATQMVTERIELRRLLDVKTSQARMSARLVSCMPVAMIAVLSLFSGDFRAGLQEPLGTGTVCFALLLNAAAWLITRKIMDVKL